VSKEFIDSLGQKSTSYHVSEPRQRNAFDRPFDNGYFFDLMELVDHLRRFAVAEKQKYQAKTWKTLTMMR
jgi:hypothetical protein